MRFEAVAMVVPFYRGMAALLALRPAVAGCIVCKADEIEMM